MATDKRRLDFFIRKLRWLDAIGVHHDVDNFCARVALVIGSYMNSLTGDTFVGRATIAEKISAKTNVRTVDRAITRLEEIGFLKVVRSLGRTNKNTYSMAFPETVETAAHTPPFKTEKAAAGYGKGGESDDKQRREDRPNLKNLTLSRTLEQNGDEKFDVATPPPTPRSMQQDGPKAFKAEGLKPFTPTAPRSFKDRGSFEQRIAQMLTEAGVDGWDALQSMDEHKVAALCRRLRNKVLTPEEIADECAAYRQRRARAVG